MKIERKREKYLFLNEKKEGRKKLETTEKIEKKAESMRRKGEEGRQKTNQKWGEKRRKGKETTKIEIKEKNERKK